MQLTLNRQPLKKGKYFDLIQKDWENGLITFIEEVLSGFLTVENKIRFNVYYNNKEEIYIKMDGSRAHIELSTLKIVNSNLLNNPYIAVNIWASPLPCENSTIKYLRYEEKMDLTKIKNNKIYTFIIHLDSISNFKKLENFDFSQVEYILLEFANTRPHRNIFKFFLYKNCKLLHENKYLETLLKFISFVSLLTFSKIELIDPSLFQDIEAYF